MESLSNVVTGSSGGFIPAFSHIQQIIQKSDSIIPFIQFFSYICLRIILASIRQLGGCPCPRCLTRLSEVHNLGTARDMAQCFVMARIDDNQRRAKVAIARILIYDKHYAVDSIPVENRLKGTLLVPTSVHVLLSIALEWMYSLNSFKNAFSDRLSQFGFNLFSMLVVDLMHEFELGVWKMIFIHLLRILQSVDGKLLVELDYR
jgi:hypothetical protein